MNIYNTPGEQCLFLGKKGSVRAHIASKASTIRGAEKGHCLQDKQHIKISSRAREVFRIHQKAFTTHGV